MPPSVRRVPLPGSERAPLPGAKASGKPKQDERISVTLILRPNPRAERVSVEEMSARPPLERTYLTREEIEAARGATKEDIAKVESFAAEHALDVVEVSPARRSVVLSGTVAQLGRAFGVELARYKHRGGEYRGHLGPVYLTSQLAPIVQAVLGLDDRPQAATRLQGAASSTR